MNKQKSRIPQGKTCLNCGAFLTAQFCAECGQKNKDYRLSFKDLFSDFLEELLDVDSRVLKSLRILFTRPGLLTTEYIKGRRISYLPPVRIYLVASILFFLAISLNTLVPNIQNNELFQEWTQTGNIDEALTNTLATQVQSLTGDRLGEVAADSSTNAVSVSVGENNFDVQQDDFLSNFSDNIAKMMFLLLPVAALQLKMLYWRRKKLYIEHLIFSLHVHAFIFSLLIITVILDFKVVMWAVLIWSLVYLYLAMKNYYGQSYSKTFAKMFLLLLSYGLAIMLVMTITLVATAVGLVLGGAG